MPPTPMRLFEKLQTCTAEELGRFGERLWANVFRAADMYWVPLHAIENGRAPMAQGPRNIILPDAEVSRCGLRLYAEIKAKRHPVLFGRANEWRHGINGFNWRHYVDISQLNGSHCCIGIFEAFRDRQKTQFSGALLLNSLVKLGPPRPGFSTQEHMIYWPRRHFQLVRELTMVETLELWKSPTAIPLMAARLREILDIGAGPPIQRALF